MHMRTVTARNIQTKWYEHANPTLTENRITHEPCAPNPEHDQHEEGQRFGHIMGRSASDRGAGDFLFNDAFAIKVPPGSFLCGWL